MNQFNRLRAWLSSTSFLMLVSGCIPGDKQTIVVRTINEPTLAIHAKNTPKTPIQDQRTITIWIHGTKGSSRMVPINAVKNFFNCKPGLHHWSETEKQGHIRKIANILIQTDPRRFAQEDFYLFGWSGLLSFQAREQAAQDLYNALLELIAHYQRDTHSMPNIRIITHSHGGNVALLLAEIMGGNNQHFSIQELILLACPVQDRTAHLVSSSIFKKIYSIYSSGDLFQIGDPQGAYKDIEAQSFFSRRSFPPQQHMRQVMIKFNGRSIAHIEFILTHFLQLLPAMIHEIDDWYENMHIFVHEPHKIDLVLNIKK